MKIRNAKPKDATEIYKLGKEIHELAFSKKFPFHELSEIKEFIKNKEQNIFLVAEEEMKNQEKKNQEKKKEVKIIGFLYAKILSHHAGGWCMLDNIAILKKYRKHGIGSLLLQELYKNLKQRKIHYVQILEAHRKSTRKFWKQKGFKETKTFIWAEKII